MKPMPAPIAIALAQYEAEARPFLKLHRLVDTYETLLKYTSALAIQNFYAVELAGAFPDTDQLIRDRITRPMLGDWAGFVREVLRCFAAREAELFSRELFLFHFKRFAANLDLQKHFTDQGASGRLLALRNRLAHGATLPDEESTALVEQHKTDLLALLDKASFLADLPLFFIESQTSANEYSALSLMGAEHDNPASVFRRFLRFACSLLGAEHDNPASVLLEVESLPVSHVIAYNPLTSAVLDLHPLLLYTECEEEVAEWDAGHRRIIGKAVCHQRKALFYNDLKAEDRIGFLDYWRGHNSRFKSPNPLPQQFRERFPKPQRAAGRVNWFEAFIREWTTHFVGRESELLAIDRFVAESSKRVLVVVAAPGMGKSALLAKWADEHQAARHFIREGDAVTYETIRVFENLGLQLRERHGVEWKSPTQLEPVAYRQAFDETLKAAVENSQGPVVVVVDGLDEATRVLARGRGMETAQTIVDYLPDPALLPEGARLILSSRPELLEHSAFAAKFGRDKAEPLALDRLTDTDVRALLYQVRSKYEVLEFGKYVDAIVERSAGSPLYLRMLLEDLSEGRVTFGQIEALPRGVVAYFERILEFIESEGRTREMPDAETMLRAKRETLDALVAQGILTPEQADEQLERERAAIAGRAGIKSVELLSLYCIAKEPLALTEAAAMLAADRAEAQRAFEVIRTILIDDDRGRFAIYHLGFRDYFLHLDDHTATKLHRHVDTIHRVQARLLDYCAGWREHRSRYALRYTAEHLREARRWDELFGLARNDAFRQAQAGGFPESPQLPLLTVQAALQGAADIDDAGGMAEFLFIHARRLIEIMQESPLDALRAGNLERAWGLADLYDIERCALWYLLLAWELKDNRRLGDARATLGRLEKKELAFPSEWKGEYAASLLAHMVEISQRAFVSLVAQLMDVTNCQTLCEHLSASGHFAAAIATARSINNEGGRIKTLRKIAAAQAQAGKKAAARATLAAALAMVPRRNSGNAWLLADVLNEIAVTQAGENEAARATFAAAFEAARSIDNESFRAGVLSKIAVAQAQAGEKAAARATFAVALETVRSIDDEGSWADVLNEIAVAQARIGEYAAALETARGIDDESSWADALSKIAAAQAQAREFAAALDTMRRIDNQASRADALRWIAVAQAQAGEFAVALEMAHKIDDAGDRVKALREIAVAQAQAGEKAAAQTTFAAALEITHNINNEWFRADTLSKINVQIAVAQAQTGEFAAALKTARDIDNEGNRVKALREIAAAQAQVGEKAAARATFAVALETVRSIDDEGSWADVLNEIAVAQARIGEYAAALETARGIDDAWDRAKALREIAAVQARAGEKAAAQTTFAAALEAARGIDDSWGRARALREIAATKNAGKGAAGAIFADVLADLEGTHSIDTRNIWSLVDKLNRAVAAEMFRAGAQNEIAVAQAQAGAQNEIAVAQAQAGAQEAARATFAAALETVRNIDETENRAKALRDIAAAQTRAGFGEQAVKITETILTNRSNHLLGVAVALAEVKDKAHFKQLLTPCAYYLDAAYRMCGLLARLYPEQATAVAKVFNKNTVIE